MLGSGHTRRNKDHAPQTATSATCLLPKKKKKIPSKPTEFPQSSSSKYSKASMMSR